jgi:Enoyl-CoA hydratase/carnithine racemase
MKISPTTQIDVQITAPVARIELTNPPLNVIALTMARELAGALAEIEARRDISIIVLNGAGSSFSAGVDIKAHLPEQIREMLTAFHSAIRAILASGKITIAVVHGRCLGGGAEMALVCDMVCTARDASWGFPEIKLGAIRQSRPWHSLQWSVRKRRRNLF